MKRGIRPAFRAVQWSPSGCAVHSGQLLAALSTDGRVSIFRPPNNRLVFEWTEVACLSDMLYKYYIEQNEFDAEEEITTAEVTRRLELLSTVSLDWSPPITTAPSSQLGVSNTFVLLALGGKRRLSLWRYYLPDPSAQSVDYRFELVNLFEAHSGYTSALSWHPYKRPPGSSAPLIATGSTDGSVCLWELTTEVSADGQHKYGLRLLNNICGVDNYAVSSLLWSQSKDHDVVIYAKGFGVGVAFLDELGQTVTRIEHLDMHTKSITGLAWHNETLMTSSIDGYIKSWRVYKSQDDLIARTVQIPREEETSALHLELPMQTTPTEEPDRSALLQMGSGGNYPRRDKEVITSTALNMLPEHPLVKQQFAINVAGDSGAFGLGLSPSSLYVACLTQTAANPDQMFSKRTPGGKLIFYCIDDRQEAVQQAVETILREEPPCSLWDVIKILNERDDDHKLYIHLTSQLEAAFYKPASEVQSDLEMLSLKLSKLKALKLANVLHKNVKRDLPADTEAALEGARLRNTQEIFQLWIWSILNEFYTTHTQSGQNTSLVISPREKTSILIMCDWIVTHFADVPAPFHSIALALFRYFSSVSSSMTSPPPPPESQSKGKDRVLEETPERPKKRGRVTEPSATAPNQGLSDDRERDLVIEPESEQDSISILSNLLANGPTKGSAPSFLLPARERCPVCFEAVPFTSELTEICPNGHNLVRCMRTLLLLDRAGSWKCPMCEGKAMQLPANSFPWLQTTRAMVSCCPKCDALVSRSL